MYADCYQLQGSGRQSYEAVWKIRKLENLANLARKSAILNFLYLGKVERCMQTATSSKAAADEATKQLDRLSKIIHDPEITANFS